MEKQERRDNVRVKYLNTLFLKPWDFVSNRQKSLL